MSFFKLLGFIWVEVVISFDMVLKSPWRQSPSRVRLNFQ